MEISYRHTIQVRPYESITLECKRTIEDPTDEPFESVFEKEVKNLANMVDAELEAKAAELSDNGAIEVC